MGGVNTARDYATLMKFGHWDEASQLVQVDNPLLQGAIVSGHGYSPPLNRARLTLFVRLPSTIYQGLSWVRLPEAGLGTATGE